jgi:hypothetical protein
MVLEMSLHLNEGATQGASSGVFSTHSGRNTHVERKHHGRFTPGESTNTRCGLIEVFLFFLCKVLKCHYIMAVKKKIYNKYPVIFFIHRPHDVDVCLKVERIE